MAIAKKGNASQKSKSKQEDVELSVFKSEDSALEAPLSKDEQTRLKKFERVVQGGWDSFVEVGNALAQIRDERLDRENYGTFEEYCRKRWQYGKSHAYRLIGAAEVVSDLSPIGDISKPLSEAQIRPLLALPREEGVKAWRAAIEAAGEKPITAKFVNAAAASFLPEKRRKRRKEKATVYNPLWKQALASLDVALEAARDNQTATAALEELRGYLGELSQA